MLGLFGGINHDRLPNGLMGHMWQRPDMLAMSAAVKPAIPFPPFTQPNPLFGKKIRTFYQCHSQSLQNIFFKKTEHCLMHKNVGSCSILFSDTCANILH